jgi:hypothetical protein
MLPICGFLALAQAAQTVPAETIAIQNMRPSRMVTLVSGIMPSTAVLTADDERGVLHVRAGKEIVSQVRTYVGLFDVRPRRIRLRVETDSPIDRETSSVEAVVANNRPFRFVDATTSTEVATAPRLNDDGTVTLFIEASYQGSVVSIIGRCRPGQPFTFRLGRSGGIVEETTAKPGEGREWPTLRISATGVDETPKTAEKKPSR